MSGIVVVGHGPAAHRLCASLHRLGHRGPVTVLAAEPHAAYNRALLLSVLDGTLPGRALELAAPPGNARVRRAAVVTGIDRARREVRTADGTGYGYEVLVLATGARPRSPGFDSPAVRRLGTLADAEPPPEGPVVIAGGGLRGAGAAAALSGAGHEVTLVHSGPRLAHRDLDGPASAVLARTLEEAGVALELGRRVAGAEHGKAVLDDGRLLAAATVLACAGSVPETAVARAAGLEVRRGIVVDDRLRTGDPRIHAIGDCAEHAGAAGDSLTSAWEQADALASILTGSDRPYRPTRRVLRPGIRGLELTVVGQGGEPAPDREPAPGEESVSLSDPGGGRHARLRLREGRIRSGIVAGFPQAVAAVGRLYARDLPVPSDRLALLIGSAGGYAASGALPDTAVVCQCNNVTRGALRQAWAGGARALPELAAATRATTGCGTCVPAVGRLCAELARSAEGGHRP
ncbi:FAD-dependent oxidoreductase [Streptomyces sp. NBC_00513]|uniref:FAD-dependent oxidoreductase n=1 Tax=unclassified Streptomyces TaxID=2593676 RepID=UPI00225379AE|nr:FAD-dependent oxidoreductase [Streptomyces sp. NBC_00424]MCX5076764.1 FAD-dependent oxidoreductase [Streptomyces sp. NBC_00424]WUD40220.1 FAD-dependent oxidoreductase [Streptomyces sp. NBC_00513]